MKASHLLAPLLAPMFGLAAASAPVPVSFHLTPKGAIVVPVVLEGSARASFLLDTGSNVSIIAEQLASALGARPAARTTILSASGQRAALMVRISRLTVGDEVGTHDVLAAIGPTGAINPPDVRAAKLTAEGIIGQDVLAGLRYTIDYQHRRITFHENAVEPANRADTLALESIDGRFVVVLPQEPGTVLRLVPDTGAEALVLFQRTGERVPCVALAGIDVGLAGLAGVSVGRTAVVSTLRVGAAKLTNVPAAIVQGDDGSRTADGLLPLHVFERVTFNGPEHQIWLEGRR